MGRTRDAAVLGDFHIQRGRGGEESICLPGARGGEDERQGALPIHTLNPTGSEAEPPCFRHGSLHPTWIWLHGTSLLLTSELRPQLLPGHRIPLRRS